MPVIVNVPGAILVPGEVVKKNVFEAELVDVSKVEGVDVNVATFPVVIVAPVTQLTL